MRYKLKEKIGDRDMAPSTAWLKLYGRSSTPAVALRDDELTGLQALVNRYRTPQQHNAACSHHHAGF